MRDFYASEPMSNDRGGLATVTVRAARSSRALPGAPRSRCACRPGAKSGAVLHHPLYTGGRQDLRSRRSCAKWSAPRPRLQGNRADGRPSRIVWARPPSAASLEELLRALDLSAADVVFRISSLEPMDCTPAIVDLVASSGGRFAPHFHLPLQHASDGVLAVMRRPYTLETIGVSWTVVARCRRPRSART